MVRMLFDWLITGQVVPFNPTSAERGPKYVVKTGKTPVLDDVLINIQQHLPDVLINISLQKNP